MGMVYGASTPAQVLATKGKFQKNHTSFEFAQAWDEARRQRILADCDEMLKAYEEPEGPAVALSQVDLEAL